MCGIFGWVGRNPGVPVGRGWTGLHALTHRGPDDVGAYTPDGGKVTTEPAEGDDETGVFLGNRRLSILDLSVAGNQPMALPGEGLWIVYNGEVYNYAELREELREAGHTFESDCDTEVLLHAYAEWGTDCVERFRGMFAFAVWDERSRTLFAARDRLGIKPFYYTLGDGLQFSSEVTALLSAELVEPTLDQAAVADYLTLGYVPAPRTIIDGVCALPPGTMLTYDADADDHSIETYWKPTFGGSGGQGSGPGSESTPDDRPDRLRSLLAESVQIRLRSDVPVGAFLSGGLDSSAIVAMMREASPEDDDQLRTFSIGFEETSYSETSYAEAVADAFGTVHTERTVTADDVRDELPEIISAMDQPTVDGVNTYFVSQTASENGLRVALSGLGGDELFFGYPGPFERVPQLYRIASALGSLPGPLGRLGASTLATVGRVTSKPLLCSIPELTAAPSTFGAAYLSVRNVFDHEDQQSLLATSDGEPLADRIEATVWDTLATCGPGDAVSHAELSWYLHNQLLRDTDGMSMAHSLEVRVPYLDRLVVDEATTTPVHRKKRGAVKQLLKDAVADDLPEAVLAREKTGFTFPFEDWLADELTPVVDAALEADLLARTPLSTSAVESVKREFLDGDRHWLELWSLVVLSLWIDEHVVAD